MDAFSVNNKPATTFNGCENVGSEVESLVRPHHNGHPTSQIPHAEANPWTYRNLVLPSGQGKAIRQPTLATHRGQLWCAWVSSDTKIYYTTGNNTGWVQSKTSVADLKASGGIAMTEFNGTLHLVYFDQYGGFNHTRYDDSNMQWGSIIAIGPSKVNGGQSTLAVIGGKIVCVYLVQNKLWSVSWDPTSGRWGSSTAVGNEYSWGLPALFIVNNQLHLVFAENDKDRKMIEVVSIDGIGWSRVTPPNQQTAFGIGATQFDGMGYVTFQANNKSGEVLVDVFDGSAWVREHESVASQMSNDTPTLAVLDGILTCVFNSRNNNSELLWAQRSVVPNPLSYWMGHLNDNLYLSQLSIPGTHDSCSVDPPVPFTATQTMSITQQLNGGIRFFDLRSALKNDILYMYHGSIRLPAPPLPVILQSMYDWIDATPDHAREAIIVQIKKDDDTEDSTMTFDDAVYRVIQSNIRRWRLDGTIPQLGQLRGKVQLVRRYSAGAPFAIGINATNWPDNSIKFTIPTGNGSLIVQDHYDFSAPLASVILDKTRMVRSSFQDAIYDPDVTHWYISYTSAADFPGWLNEPKDIAAGGIATLPPPPRFVNGVNIDTFSYLSSIPPRSRLGTVMMDFPESPVGYLVAAIVSLNG